MDTLFNKVFHNQYIRNLIFNKIKKLNESLYYQTYDYYQIQLLTILKIRNKSLALSKLNHYKQYFLNNNKNNNDNNKNYSNKNNYKYQLNVNIACIDELYKWKGVDIELVELMISIYLNENDKKGLIETKSFYRLIDNDNLEVLKIILDQCKELIKPEQYIQHLSFRKETIDQTNEFLNTYILNICSSSNNSKDLVSIETIYSALYNIVENKTTKVFGQLFLGLIKTTPIGSKISDLFLASINNGDKFMIKLLLSNYSRFFNSKSSSSPSSRPRYLFRNDPELKVEFETIQLKKLGVTTKVIYESPIFELFEELVISNHPDNKEHKFTKTTGSNSFFSIQSREITDYLVRYHRLTFISNQYLYLRLSCLPDDEYLNGTNSVYSNTFLRWDIYSLTSSKNYLSFLLNNPHIHVTPQHMFQMLLKSTNLEEFKMHVNNNPDQPIPYGAIIRSGNTPLIEYVFSNFSEDYKSKINNHPVYLFNQALNSYFPLILDSIKSDNDFTFDILVNMFNQEFRENKDSMNRECLDQLFLSYKSQFLNILSSIKCLESRIKFVDKMNKIVNLFNNSEITKQDLELYNDIGLSIIKYKDSIGTYSKVSRQFYEKLIYGSIKDGNLKLLKILLKYKSIYSVELKKGVIHFLLSPSMSSNSYGCLNDNFKIILYLISFGFINSNYLSTLIQFSLKHYNMKLLNYLMCRNDYQLQTIPFNTQQLENQKSVINSFDQHINLIHYYILRFSILKKQYSSIEYLLKEGYTYKPVSELTIIKKQFSEFLFMSQSYELTKKFVNNVGLNIIHKNEVIPIFQFNKLEF